MITTAKELGFEVNYGSMAFCERTSDGKLSGRTEPQNDDDVLLIYGTEYIDIINITAKGRDTFEGEIRAFLNTPVHQFNGLEIGNNISFLTKHIFVLSLKSGGNTTTISNK